MADTPRPDCACVLPSEGLGAEVGKMQTRGQRALDKEPECLGSNVEHPYVVVYVDSVVDNEKKVHCGSGTLSQVHEVAHRMRGRFGAVDCVYNILPEDFATLTGRSA